MDMEKIMAYVEKIAENLEGLVCAIGCDSMPSDGAIYVDGEQKVNYISTREALRILDGFGNNSASVMIGKSDYILIYDASRKLVIDGEAYLPSGYLVMKSCNGLQAIDDEDFADVIAALKSRMTMLASWDRRRQMNNKPWAYVTSAWSADRSRAKRSAKRYCRKLYEAGYTPICPLLSLPEVIDTSNADEYKDYMDMSEDMLRRSRILVVCGSAVDDTVLTDIAIANRFHVASSTMRGVLGVDKNKKEQ